jgi:uncharacterized protein YmfQ (DUF2313 family)
MSAPRYTLTQITTNFMALLPKGDAWPRDQLSNLYAFCYAICPLMQNTTDNAAMVLDQSIPSAVYNMILEWNQTLGLPDPCQGPNPTIPEQQAQILSKFISDGGQSKAFFISYANLLGYSITIKEFLPWLVGISRPGMLVPNPGAAFYWQINTSISGPQPELECELNNVKPAQTKLSFVYA